MDDKLLIDFPPDTYMHFLLHNVPLTKIKSCLLTHSHSDHLYVKDLAMRKDGFSHIYEDNSPLVFYSDESGYNMISEIKAKSDISDEEIAVKRIKLYEPFDVEEYKVTALRAMHDENATPVVFLIERDGKTIFYSNDTGGYPEESMEYLKKMEKPIDLISFDCTSGNSIDDYYGHLSLERCIKLREKLIECGAADGNTVFVLNHFSHNAKDVVYDDFVKIAAEHNFEVSYDGMIIEI